MVYTKQFSKSDIVFTLNEVSLILEASTRFKVNHVKDPKYAEDIKTLGNVGMVINTLITADPRAETYNLKGLTVKDFKATKLAIDEVLAEVPNDDELKALSDKLNKAINGGVISRVAKTTGAVLTTAAVIAACIFAAKKAKNYSDNKKKFIENYFAEKKPNLIEDTRYRDDKKLYDELGKEFNIDPKDIAEGVERYTDEAESVRDVIKRSTAYRKAEAIKKANDKTADINARIRNLIEKEGHKRGK